MDAPVKLGRFEFHPETRQLLIDGKPALLGVRAFDVLEKLIEARDRLVTKDELLDAAWPGLAVEENNLQVQISTLRKVLGPNAIVTSPGRGYRFALSVSDPSRSNEPQHDSTGSKRHRFDNLPTPLTALIGRESDAQELRTILQRSRLATVTGVGGIGKTRLALHVAAEARDGFADGVRWIEVTLLQHDMALLAAVASAFGVRERDARSIEMLAGALRSREALLVLDNCEHFVDSTAAFCQLLLAGCPDIRILVTSREVLHVPGEAIYRTPPLEAPDPGLPITAGELLRFPAARLFAESARSVQPSFEVDARNARQVAECCKRLDGIPLAIELAAARLGSMSLGDVHQRLDHRLPLLGTGSRATVAHHQTLTATLDWSYAFLPDAEQAAFRRLAVFAGGWTLGAANEICSDSGDDPAETIEWLTSLVDKSMVSIGNVGGVPRYRMLETVREYADGRLRERGEDIVIRQRHLAYFLSLAEEGESQLGGTGQLRWLDTIDRERANFHAALSWSLGSFSRLADGLRLAGALGSFWWMRGSLSEGRRWLWPLLEAASRVAPVDVRAKAVRAAASIAMGQADYAAAKEMHERALAISRELGDRKGIADALLGLGYWVGTQSRSEGEAARARFEESLDLYREIGDRRGVAMALNGLGAVALLTVRDYALARIRHEEALAAFLALGDRHGAGYAITGFGYSALLQGDFSRAAEHYREAIELARGLGDQRGIAESLDGLAGAAAPADAVRAARIWGAAKRLREDCDCLMVEAMQVEYERQVADARRASGDGASFEQAWADGRAMTLDEAIAYALGAS